MKNGRLDRKSMALSYNCSMRDNTHWYISSVSVIYVMKCTIVLFYFWLVYFYSKSKLIF